MLIYDGVLRGGCLTDHRMNDLRVLATLEVQDVSVRVLDVADPLIEVADHPGGA